MLKMQEFGRRLTTLGTLVIMLNMLTTVVFAQEGAPGFCTLCGCSAALHYLLCWPPFPAINDLCYTHIFYSCNYGLPGPM